MNIRKALIEKKWKGIMIDEVPAGWQSKEKKEYSLTKEKLVEKSLWDYDRPFKRDI